MFELKNNYEIGQYLSGLINRCFEKQRRFAKACVMEQTGVADENVSDAEIQNMANRISQMCKGAKGIQIEDLPIFTKLLGVTCEEILSAGTYFVPAADRMTNYSIAFSKDTTIWEQYIRREDKLILNEDEYGKTVIDYALKFKNFAFLKYLMDNKYIWFVDAEGKDYAFRFGAGTSIERRPLGFHDSMQYRLAEQDGLRMQMIALAIENNDIEMLSELHARETPLLYKAVIYPGDPTDSHGKPENNDSQYQTDMIKNLVNASYEILDYFLEEFVIERNFTDKNGSFTHNYTFMFPYTSDLLDLLIKDKSKYAETALKKAISHNKSTYDTLRKLMDNEIKSFDTNHGVWVGGDIEDDDIAKEIREKKKHLQDNKVTEILKNFDFYDSCDIIKFLIYTRPRESGIITNIFHTREKTKDSKLNSLTLKLNALYDEICNFRPQLTEVP